MSDIDKALFYQITKDAGVSALIGNRLYEIEPPQNASMPLATYQWISGNFIGVHGEQSVLPRARCQITSYANTAETARAVDSAIRNAIDGTKFTTWGTGTYITTINECRADTTQRDAQDPVARMYQRSRDYFIMWT